MILKVSNIKAEGIQCDLSDKLIVQGETPQEIPFTVNLKGLRDKKTVLISGNINANVELVCSRCLENYRAALDTHVHITYVPEEERPTGEEKHKLTEEETNVSFYKDDEIDVSDMLREQITINIPMKTLCTAECKGLCHICGINLNVGHCDCKKENIDTRWISLKKLLNERKG